MGCTCRGSNFASKAFFKSARASASSSLSSDSVACFGNRLGTFSRFSGAVRFRLPSVTAILDGELVCLFTFECSSWTCGGRWKWRIRVAKLFQPHQIQRLHSVQTRTTALRWSRIRYRHTRLLSDHDSIPSMYRPTRGERQANRGRDVVHRQYRLEDQFHFRAPFSILCRTLQEAQPSRWTCHHARAW